jgi:hypothetical protein
MAYVIAALGAFPEPQPGEAKMFLCLTFDPSLGYRMRAETDQGRVIARWVSDCPIAVCETTFLWVDRYRWVVETHPDSQIDVNAIMETPDRLIDLDPAQHPRDVLAALVENFPPHPSAAPPAEVAAGPGWRGRRGLHRPRPSEAPPVPQEAPARTTALARPMPSARPLVPRPTSPPAAPVPAAPATEKSDEQVLYQVVLHAARRLRAKEDVLDACRPIYELFGIEDPPEQTPPRRETLGTLIEVIERLKQREKVADVTPDLLAVLGYEIIPVKEKDPEIEGDDPEVDEEVDAPAEMEAIDPAAIDAELAEVDAELAELNARPGENGRWPGYPEGLRPLLPEENLEGLTEEQARDLESLSGDDASIREKLLKTHQRAETRRRQIQLHDEQRRRAQAREATAPAPAPRPTVPPPLDPVEAERIRQEQIAQAAERARLRNAGASAAMLDAPAPTPAAPAAPPVPVKVETPAPTLAPAPAPVASPVPPPTLIPIPDPTPNLVPVDVPIPEEVPAPPPTSADRLKARRERQRQQRRAASARPSSED